MLKKHYQTVHETKIIFNVTFACQRHYQAIHAKEKNFKWTSLFGCYHFEETCWQSTCHMTQKISTWSMSKFLCSQLCSKVSENSWKKDCGKGFFYNNEYLAHVKVVHKGEKDFKCHLCEKQFVRPGYLKSHINSAH